MFNLLNVENNKLYKEVINDQENIIEKNQQPPIRASLINRKDIDSYTNSMIESITQYGVDVDYHASVEFYKKNKIINRGSGTYAISSCDNRDKFSKGYYNCTGIVAVGTDKETGQQISFMSHQDPKMFIKNNKINLNFKKDLESVLANLMSNTEENTIDVVVFGGQYPDEPKQKYPESIKLISNIIMDKLGIDPTILTGPNISNYETDNYETDVYFDAQHRRLYLVRPYQYNNSANESYVLKDYKKQEEKWFKE